MASEERAAAKVDRPVSLSLRSHRHMHAHVLFHDYPPTHANGAMHRSVHVLTSTHGRRWHRRIRSLSPTRELAQLKSDFRVQPKLFPNESASMHRTNTLHRLHTPALHAHRVLTR